MMDLKQICIEIEANAQWYAEKHGVEINKHFAAYSLIKEIGQFADASLINRGMAGPAKSLEQEEAKSRMTQELTDIVALAVLNAKLYDIDIEKALQERWFNKTGS